MISSMPFATTDTGWNWVIGLAPYMLIGGFIILTVLAFMEKFGPYLPWIFRRRKPIKQNIRNYDEELIHDLKRGAVRNKVPARLLHIRDSSDPEFPYIYYGKIRGVNAHGDVFNIVVRKKWGLLSEVLFIPRSKVSDLNSRDLYLECTGFYPVARWFWVPIWGASINATTREELNKVVNIHIAALYDVFRSFVGREQGTAQMEKAMTSTPREVLERLAENETVPAPPREGEERID